jgi:hypothetical protein
MLTIATRAYEFEIYFAKKEIELNLKFANLKKNEKFSFLEN